MENLIRKFGKCIKIYLAKETVDDPYEKNVELTYLNPIPIKGIVQDLIFSQLSWKMPGIVATKAKEIIIEKKYKNLLEMSYKIKVDGDSDFYCGWKIQEKMQIREEGDYIRCYIYNKKS